MKARQLGARFPDIRKVKADRLAKERECKDRLIAVSGKENRRRETGSPALTDIRHRPSSGGIVRLGFQELATCSARLDRIFPRRRQAPLSSPVSSVPPAKLR